MLGTVTLPNSWSSMPGPNAGPSAWANAYAQMGQASTAANQQLGNIFASGSNQVLAQQQAALRNAFGYLKGINRANVRSIDRRFAAESGDIMQSLINRGLGNSTIQGSMRTGLTRAHADAISGSRAAFGGKMYEAAYQNALANSQLAQSQLNTQFQGTNIGYPDMGAFAQMAAMSGQGGGGMGSAFGGGGGLIMGDMSRPVGGALPAWAHYSGGADPFGGMGGGGGGDMSWATGYNVPSWNVAQGAVGGGGTDWGDLFAGGNAGGMGDIA
jgi:hypothetical protein